MLPEPTPSSHPRYRDLWTRDRHDGFGALHFVQNLFVRTAPYLDARLADELQVHFPERFWEMCVVSLLLDAGLELTPTNKRPRRSSGPDVLLADGRTWVEAISVGPGTGRDRLEPITPSSVQTVLYLPDERITLRLTSGIADKAQKGRSYFDTGLLSPGDRFIIAINAAEVPWACHEQGLPRIVKALYPLGNRELTLDSAGNVTSSRYQFRPEIRKQTGKTVPTSFFLSPDSSHVSAVLYGCMDEYNRHRSGKEAAILVHNLNARNPLPPGTIRVGREYVAGDTEVTLVEHSATAP